MSEFSSDLLRLLSERGYIHQTTDAAALDALAAKQVVPGYIGFDPTAPSLHVGSLVQIMLLRRLQQAGHKPYVLMGGGTGKIGDPSFKDEARKLSSDDVIAANIAGIQRIFDRFLTFGDGATDAVMVNNAEWLDKLEYIPFLREIGQHFSVNRMLSFDSVKLRLDREQSLSFLEFNYMILQGYDFRELARRHGVRIQMGGSDQWGNIVNGIELARRMDGTEVFGITTPLLTTADGQKMGKTVAGAVWLHEDQLPHFDYWQFWRNTDDRDVGRFLRLFTDLPLDEIARLEALNGAPTATYATAIRQGGLANGAVIGVLGVHFDWQAQAQTVVDGVRLTPDEKARTRVLLLDQTHRVLAASDGVGVLSETVKLDVAGGVMGSYAKGGRTVGYARTPGYETYQGLGWYGCLVQDAVAI